LFKNRYAYIEFATLEGAENSLKLTDSLLNERKITVEKKRKNIPGMGRKRAYGPYRGFPGRGMPMGMMPPFMRGSRRFGGHF